MSWWLWLLVGWLPLAAALALVIGRGIRLTDLRERPPTRADEVPLVGDEDDAA